MLVDYERDFVSILFDAEPSERAIERLGGLRERWLLYRDMVRSRMQKMIENGLPRTVKALGDERYGAMYAQWLAESPPRTRYIREIVPAFVAFATPRWNADESVPRWAIELAEYESTRWVVGQEHVEWPSDVSEFTFEKIAVMNPTLRLLRFEHRVSDPLPEGATDYERKKTAVIVYRRPDNDRIGAWIPNALSADLVEGWLREDASVAEVVKRVCAEKCAPIDENLVESLGTMLAGFLEKGIVLGGR
jgi:hypothetical protein